MFTSVNFSKVSEVFPNICCYLLWTHLLVNTEKTKSELISRLLSQISSYLRLSKFFRLFFEKKALHARFAAVTRCDQTGTSASSIFELMTTRIRFHGCFEDGHPKFVKTL